MSNVSPCVICREVVGTGTHMQWHARRGEVVTVLRPLLSKDDADCCQTVASRDPHGRPPIGFCSPECLRRPRVVASAGPWDGPEAA